MIESNLSGFFTKLCILNVWYKLQCKQTFCYNWCVSHSKIRQHYITEFLLTQCTDYVNMWWKWVCSVIWWSLMSYLRMFCLNMDKDKKINNCMFKININFIANPQCILKLWWVENQHLNFVFAIMNKEGKKTTLIQTSLAIQEIWHAQKVTLNLPKFLTMVLNFKLKEPLFNRFKGLSINKTGL